MRKFLVGAVAFSCLASLGLSIPAQAEAVNDHVAAPPCTAMGLSTSSLTPLFGSTVVAKASSGNICIVATNPETVYVQVHFYPTSAKASWTKSYGGAFVHAKRLGGLGAGAEYFTVAGGHGDELYLTRGRHFAFIYTELLPSSTELLSLAHIIYRALA
jgi:hypothetical protein